MTDSRHDTYIGLNVFALVISVFASVLAMIVGYRVGINNGHGLLVFFMNFFQLSYAISVYFVNLSVVHFDYDQFIINETISMASGVMSTFLSNVLAYVAVYIIYYSKSVQVVEYFHWIMIASATPAIVVGIAYLAVSYPENSADYDAQDFIVLDIYFYIRIISIAINFIFSFITLYKIHQISTKQGRRSLHEVALRTLAKRMVLYPIVQALGRSGYAFYEGMYGNDVTPLPYIDQTQYDIMIFCVLVTPCISVGYLCIFLFMQPEALIHIKTFLFECKLYNPPPKNAFSTNRNAGADKHSSANVTNSSLFTIDRTTDSPSQPTPNNTLYNTNPVIRNNSEDNAEVIGMSQQSSSQLYTKSMLGSSHHILGNITGNVDTSFAVRNYYSDTEYEDEEDWDDEYLYQIIHTGSSNTNTPGFATPSHYPHPSHPVSHHTPNIHQVFGGGGGGGGGNNYKSKDIIELSNPNSASRSHPANESSNPSEPIVVPSSQPGKKPIKKTNNNKTSSYTSSNTSHTSDNNRKHTITDTGTEEVHNILLEQHIRNEPEDEEIGESDQHADNEANDNSSEGSDDRETGGNLANSYGTDGNLASSVNLSDMSHLSKIALKNDFYGTSYEDHHIDP
jgi:hypothetical protein